ncbi:AcfA family outer membrane beta-barrel protein [Vibrio rhodolitus]|uniref:AcfA family outer membrane beta-barrel protein n=1 Tax=Vibrio rhodolitus TaxID=2231649 RepID=UPI000E0C3FD9|nr:AcfA family outer membrane beta-barrel protein [Vibrio rhodolitus]
MNKICLFSLLACSFPAAASPYLGLEMGRSQPDHDIKVYTAKNRVVTPDSNDVFLGVYGGYVLNKSWAFEAGYQQNQYTGTATTQNRTTLDAEQFYFAPVYNLSLTNDRDWDLKLKGGVTYTQYDLSGQSGNLTATANSSELGLMLAVGVEYQLMPELGVGANIKYVADSYTSSSAFTLSASYYF